MLLCILYCKQIAFNKTQTDLTDTEEVTVLIYLWHSVTCWIKQLRV